MNLNFVSEIMQHPIIEEIKKEMYLVGHLNSPAKIQCISDGAVSFHIYDSEDKRSYHYLYIIVKNPEFWDDMTAIEILNSKNISFLQHKYFSDGEEFCSKIYCKADCR